jgi:IstB-like ATP binding protein
MCRPSSTATSVVAAITIEEVVMLNHPTIDRLRDLGLVGMIHALEEQQRQPDSTQLTFEDRLAMLVDREVLERDNKRLKTRLRFAGLRQMASPEDVDYRAHRGLDRGLFQRLSQGEWIERQQNLLITGPTGVGKTMDRLCSRPPSLPRQPLGALSARAAYVGRTWPRTR